jgi:hypothetical protein
MDDKVEQDGGSKQAVCHFDVSDLLISASGCVIGSFKFISRRHEKYNHKYEFQQSKSQVFR